MSRSASRHVMNQRERRFLWGKESSAEGRLIQVHWPLPLHKSSRRETALKVQLVKGKVMTWGGRHRKRRGNSPCPPSHLLVALGHLVPSAPWRAQGS